MPGLEVQVWQGVLASGSVVSVWPLLFGRVASAQGVEEQISRPLCLFQLDGMHSERVAERCFAERGLAGDAESPFLHCRVASSATAIQVEFAACS